MCKKSAPNNVASNGGGWISKKRRHAIYKRDNYRCVYCGEYVTAKDRTLDHITPQALGGEHDSKNLMLACNVCNATKGKKSLFNFLWWLVHSKGRDTSLIRRRIKNRKRRKL